MDKFERWKIKEDERDAKDLCYSVIVLAVGILALFFILAFLN